MEGKGGGKELHRVYHCTLVRLRGEDEILRAQVSVHRPLAKFLSESFDELRDLVVRCDGDYATAPPSPGKSCSESTAAHRSIDERIYQWMTALVELAQARVTLGHQFAELS